MQNEVKEIRNPSFYNWYRKNKDCKPNIFLGEYCFQGLISAMISQPLLLLQAFGNTNGILGRGGVLKPPSPKFRSFDKAEPNSQFRGKYSLNNVTRIQLSLIFSVAWKALPASYDPHSGIFFFLSLSKAWRDVSIKYQKLRKFYHMKWNFLYQITAASRTPD